MFGSNYHVNEPKGLLLENYTRSRALIDQHVKSFARPSKVVGASNPHFFHLINPEKMFNINKKKMSPPYYFDHTNIPYEKTPAYIAHYVYQSEASYIKRKIDLPRDDNGQFRGKLPDIHVDYNDVENLAPKEKYATRVKKFLAKYMKPKKSQPLN